MNGETIGQLALFKEALDNRQIGPDSYVVPGNASEEYYSGSIEQDKAYLAELLNQRDEYLSLIRQFDDAFMDSDSEDGATQAIPLGVHNVQINESLAINPGDKLICRIIDLQYAHMSDEKRMALEYAYGPEAIIIESASATTEDLSNSQKIDNDRTNQLFTKNSIEDLGIERNWYELGRAVFGSNRYTPTEPGQQQNTEVMGDPSDANAPMQAARYAESIGNELSLLKDVCSMIAQGVIDFGSQDRIGYLELDDPVKLAWLQENLTLDIPPKGQHVIHELIRKVVVITEEPTADIIDLRDGREPKNPIYDQTLHTKDSDFSNA